MSGFTWPVALGPEPEPAVLAEHPVLEDYDPETKTTRPKARKGRKPAAPDSGE